MDRQVALVTGAARGLGKAVARRLVNDAWIVVAADKQAVAGQAGIRAIRADVAIEADVAALVADVRDREGRLDAIVSNAGFMIRKPLAELTLDEWTSVIATNLTATFLLARAAAAMLRESRGAIVTIASTRARMSEPGTESYAASKGGLVALTHALAISLGPDVRVNAVSPGWIDVRDEIGRGEPLTAVDHAQHPVGRVGQPEDVAALVAWLIGPESGFVTGAEFVLDGGMTRKMIYAE